MCTAVDAWFICCTDLTLHFVMIVFASHHSLNISNKSTKKEAVFEFDCWEVKKSSKQMIIAKYSMCIHLIAGYMTCINQELRIYLYDVRG